MAYNQHRANVRNGLAGLSLREVRLVRDGSVAMAVANNISRASRECHAGIVKYANEFIRELEAELDGYASGNDYPLPCTD